MTKLYHSTTRDAADKIDVEGFRDSRDPEPLLTGVYFSNTRGDYGTEVVYEVDVPDDIAAEHAAVAEDEDGPPPEWIIPARIVNTLPRRRIDEGAR